MPFDPESTLIRRGRTAVTMTEMAVFVKTLEDRPVSTLLQELPELAQLSDTKFSLALTTLRRRFRGEKPVDQLQLRASAWEIARDVTDRNTADRIRGIFTLEHA